MTQSQFPFEIDPDRAGAARRLAVASEPGHYDELLDARGGLRPIWRRFFEQLGGAGLDDLGRREQSLLREVQEHGVTYNVYSDETGAPRRWSLDLLPFLVDEPDWRVIESAVRQRAAVLSAILRDVYGPQDLLRGNLLPPALVLGSPGYVRALHGVEPPGGIHLHVVAFDLARGPDGRWWVLGHRTQAPSGLGYALENRLIVSRLFPDCFAALRAQRLAASYRRLLETLVAHAPRNEAPPDAPANIVLLTAGRYSETYFEQSYLARYLGVPLVEGSDLTVRDGRLYLKTLHGLERVHAMIRRLDDMFCDPLELRPDSALGVAGLIEAIRRGSVLVANAPGTAFLESPAIHGFLPAIARRLLGEELLLPPRDSWWCGEDAARLRAFAGLRTARLRATYRGVGREPAIARGDGLVRLEDVRAEIEENPDWYTIQSYLPYSKAPCWSRQGIQRRSAVLRVYAIATGRGAWHVMPGGLTRIADRQDEVSMQRGGSSADTWVVTGEEVDPFTMLPDRRQAVEVVFRRRVVTSRAAENLFWLGRYTERTENAARAAQRLLSHLPVSESLPEAVLDALGRTAVALGLVRARTRATPAALEESLLGGLHDEEASSVAFDLAALARAAAQIRDRLAFEHWRQITSTVEAFQAGARLAHARPAEAVEERAAGEHAQASLEEALAALASLLAGIGTITAAQTDGMTRDDGWRLLTIGRQIERLVNMCEILHAFFDSRAALHVAGFEHLLALFNSTVTYRSRYQGQREIAALVDLVFLEAANPRSPACAVDLIGRELGLLSAATGQRIEWRQAAHFAPARERLLGELCRRDAEGRFECLLGLTGDLAGAARGLSDEIGLRYFSHSDTLRSQVV